MEDFPIFRGAPEWHIARRRADAPGIAAIGLGGPNRAEGPYCERIETAQADRAGLAEALARLTADYALIASDRVAPLDEEAFWEAARMFELHLSIGV